MNISKRVHILKAMEFIARQINDENVFEPWLMYGVADGDIESGTLHVSPYDIENLKDYVEDDKQFSELMGLFLRLMKRANESGGLFCDNVCSEFDS